MGVTIVCADDDRNFCQILARALRAEGFAVETVHDGETALERVRALEPALVTLDVMLPRRDGFSVLEALRADGGAFASLPVVLFSGCRFSPLYTERAEALRADAVLQKPVPLERILQTVRELARVERPKPKARAAARSRRAHRGATAEHAAAMPEPSGSLETLPVPMLLHQMHGLRASGVLELRSGKKKKQVQLREGRPVAVRSNLVHETLGQLLLASGTITEDVLHESLLRVKRGEGLHGQILKAMQMLDEQDLARALRRQAEEKLFEIFAWSRGEYRFVRGARVRDANALTLKRHPASLILEGVRTRTPLDVVDRYLAERGSRFPALNESPFFRFQEADLDAAATRMLERLDGATALGELLSADEAERRLLFGLAAVELVVLHDEPKTDAPRVQAEAVPERPLPPRAATPAAPAPDAARSGSADTGALGDAEQAVRSELAAMAERLRGRDVFGVLGLDRSASDAQIRQAYTDLAKRTHPDRFSASGEAVRRVAEEVFGIISHAYERIGSPKRRAAFFAEERQAEEDQADLEEAQRALRAEQAFQRGQQALRGRQYERALACFREAVETYEEGDYHAYYAWAFYLAEPDAHGRIQEALRRAKQARKLAPDREKPYLILGRLQKAAGRMDVAEKMFTRAVQLDPDCVEALRELRLIHMRREKSKGLVRRILRR